MGTSTPTTVDCVIFGHVGQFLDTPMDFPQKGFLLSDCPGLVGLVERTRACLWPDWERMCTKECMDGLWGLPRW